MLAMDKQLPSSIIALLCCKTYGKTFWRLHGPMEVDSSKKNPKASRRMTWTTSWNWRTSWEWTMPAWWDAQTLLLPPNDLWDLRSTLWVIQRTRLLRCCNGNHRRWEPRIAHPASEKYLANPNSRRKIQLTQRKIHALVRESIAIVW